MDIRDYYRNLFRTPFRYSIFSANYNRPTVTTTTFNTAESPVVQLSRTFLGGTTNNLELAVNNLVDTYVFVESNYTVLPGQVINLRNTTLLSLYFGEGVPTTYTLNFLPGSTLLINNGSIVNLNIVGNPRIVAYNANFEFVTYNSADPIAIRSGVYNVNNSTFNSTILFNYTPEMAPTAVRITNSVARSVALINIMNNRGVNTRLNIVLRGSQITGQVTIGNPNGVEIGIVR